MFYFKTFCQRLSRFIIQGVQLVFILYTLFVFSLASAQVVPEAQTNLTERLEFNSSTTGVLVARTEHFDILYRHRFKWAVSDVAFEAESAYQKLNAVLGGFPDERITIHLVDSADGPINQTLTAPQPFLRIWVAPVGDENGYGHLKVSSRFGLLIGHELVHLAMGSWEGGGGKLFGQVRATTDEPATFPFALVTQSKRFAPLWFHEGAAVFLETWLMEGHGRIVGNLDEAYFRAQSLNKSKVPDWKNLDSITLDGAFNINGAYFYGARFMSWVSKKYGSEKLISWFRDFRGASLNLPFGESYRRIFNSSLSKDWHDFFVQEYDFQKNNIATLNAKKPQRDIKLIGQKTGLVSKTYFDPLSGNVYFIEIPINVLPRVVRFDLETGEKKILARTDVGAPAFVNVSVTAFDSQRQIFYFSKDSTVGWRDLYQLDLTTNNVTKVVENLRQTNLAVEPNTGDLWGTILFQGESHLARLKRPFDAVEIFSKLPHHVSIRDFSFSPDGKIIAAVLQNHSRTSLILIDPTNLIKGDKLSFEQVTDYVDPENPTWSLDGENLYFSSYENGVSNVYGYNVTTEKVVAITNVVDGLYKPVVLGKSVDALNESAQVLAFKLLGKEGFQPVLIPADIEYELADIDYLGTDVITAFNEYSIELYDSSSKLDSAMFTKDLVSSSEKYQSIKQIKLNTVVPTFGQSAKGDSTFGLYASASDILNHHQFNAQIATNSDIDELSWNFNYLYKDVYALDIRKNQSSLYALVNDSLSSGESWSATLSRRFWHQADEAGVKVLDFNVGYDDSLERVFTGFNYLSQNTQASISGKRPIETGWSYNVNANIFSSIDSFDSLVDEIDGLVSANVRLYDTYFVPHNRVSLLVEAATSIGEKEVGFQVRGFPNQTFESRGVDQFTNSAILPGLDSSNGITANHFTRIQLENSFPVIRLNLGYGSQQADLLSIKAFVTGLYADSLTRDNVELQLHGLYSVGVQANIEFKHFFNLDSTLALGYASVWDDSFEKFDSHGFISWNWFSF